MNRDELKNKLRNTLKKHPDLYGHLPEGSVARIKANEILNEEPALVKAIENAGYFVDAFMNAPQFGPEATSYQPKQPELFSRALDMLRNRKQQKALPPPKEKKGLIQYCKI